MSRLKNLRDALPEPNAVLEFRKVTRDDIRDLFAWRNHPDVRGYFFNPNPISWKEHKGWFAKKSKDPDTTMYLIYCEGEKIGIVRYEDKADAIAVSVMLNPIFLGKGFGSKIIALGTQKFVKQKRPDKPIIAEIKRGNIASIKAFQKAGFKESFSTYVFARDDERKS